MPANVMLHKMCDPNGDTAVPGVVIRRPGPVRETPLPGLKSLKSPVASTEFQRVMAQRGLDWINPRGARIGSVLGWAGLGMAVACLLVTLLLLCKIALPEPLLLMTALWLVAVHLCAVFSQMLSASRNLPGALAIPVLYFGYVGLMTAEWLFRLWIL